MPLKIGGNSTCCHESAQKTKNSHRLDVVPGKIVCLSSGKQCLQQCPRWRTAPRYTIKARARRIKLSPNSSTATEKKKEKCPQDIYSNKKFPKPNKIKFIIWHLTKITNTKKQESISHYEKNYQSNEMNPKLINRQVHMKTVILQIVKNSRIQKILKRFKELQEMKAKIPRMKNTLNRMSDRLNTKEHEISELEKTSN